MADRVQLALEQMLPQLEDLVKHKIFSKEEIKKVIAKRTKFEEKLAGAGFHKETYYEYIKYEILLEELKKKKKKRLGIKLPEDVARAGVLHIKKIYQRALTKYYDDPKLWEDFIQFIRRSNILRGMLGQVFVSALQKHPRNASLWKQAALWEFDNNNIHAARALCQRAIRINPTNQQLWINYFNLELKYLMQVRDNYKTVGVEIKEKSKIAETENFLSLSDLPDDESQKPAQEKLQKDLSGYSEELLTRSKPFLEGGIPKIVFHNALLAFPNDFQFCWQFYERTTRFTKLKTLREDILQHITTAFPHNGDALLFLGKEKIKLNDTFANCWNMFDEAIKSAQPASYSAIFDAYVTFHKYLLDLQSNQTTSIFNHMISVLQNARKANALTETSYSIWIESLINSKQTAEAEKMLQEALQQYPGNITLWKTRIGIPAAKLSGSKAEAEEAFDQVEELYLQAFKAIQNKEASQSLWIDFFKTYFEHMSQNFDEIMEHYKKCLYNLLDQSGQLRMAFLAMIQENKELNTIATIRKVYNLYVQVLVNHLIVDRTLSIPPSPVEYYLECIKAERAHGGDVAKIRGLFEKAVHEYGKYNDDLWLDFIQFEYQNQNLTQGINIYWRAKKTLEDPTEFVRKYVLSTNGMDPSIANLE